RCTPVVVSSVTPRIPAATRDHRCASSARQRCSTPSTTAYSCDSALSGEGTAPAFSNRAPWCTSNVASPPSSRIMFGPPPSGHNNTCSVHHQYSASVRARVAVGCKVLVMDSPDLLICPETRGDDHPPYATAQTACGAVVSGLSPVPPPRTSPGLVPRAWLGLDVAMTLRGYEVT